MDDPLMKFVEGQIKYQTALNEFCEQLRKFVTDDDSKINSLIEKAKHLSETSILSFEEAFDKVCYDYMRENK